jgi:hypothetical membrane protein
VVQRRNLLGFLGPFIGMVSVLVSILAAPSFNWADNALSDLGNWFRNDIGPYPILRAAIFNVGLIVGGILIVCFAYLMVRELYDAPTKVALLSFAASGTFLAGVGVFSETIPVGHAIAALGFFLTIPISMLLVGLAWIRISTIRVYACCMFLLAAVAILLFQPWTSIAVWEYTMSIIASAGIWFVDFLDLKARLDVLKS